MWTGATLGGSPYLALGAIACTPQGWGSEFTALALFNLALLNNVCSQSLEVAN